MNQDKMALAASAAGRRFMAYMQLYNGGDEARLLQFIHESYQAPLLEQMPAEARLSEWQARKASLGNLRVKQVLASSDHHVIVALSCQHSADLYYMEFQVEADYPHHIIGLMFAKLEALEE